MAAVAGQAERKRRTGLHRAVHREVAMTVGAVALGAVVRHLAVFVPVAPGLGRDVAVAALGPLLLDLEARDHVAERLDVRRVAGLIHGEALDHRVRADGDGGGVDGTGLVRRREVHRVVDDRSRVAVVGGRQDHVERGVEPTLVGRRRQDGRRRVGRRRGNERRRVVATAASAHYERKQGEGEDRMDPPPSNGPALHELLLWESGQARAVASSLQPGKSETTSKRPGHALRVGLEAWSSAGPAIECHLQR